jgi:hypothetical protein
MVRKIFWISEFLLLLGFFVQWSMSIGVLCTGFVIHSILGFPGFEPIAVLGGMFWAIGEFFRAYVYFCLHKNV